MILTEQIPASQNRLQIVEGSGNGNKPFRVKAILQRANVPNQNKRIYPRAILEREAIRYTNEFIKNRNALGELDHVDSQSVNLKNVCHNIVELHWEGDDLCGTLEVLTTPAGNILRELLQNGINVGISSRGMGSVKELEEGIVEVGEDFCLLTWDAVSNPSVQGAFLHEGLNVMEQARTARLDGYIREFLEQMNS